MSSSSSSKLSGSSSGGGGGGVPRRRSGRAQVEDETLSQIAKEAEARLALKRAARIEAREIRMRELERQQKESQDKPEKDAKSSSSLLSKGSLVSSSSVQNSVTSSTLQLDPSAGVGTALTSLGQDASVQELREALSCVEEKYRKAMVQNAQLDNERVQLTYHTQQLRDLLEEQDDQFYRLKKEHRDKCQEVEKQKRLLGVLNKRNSDLKYALQQRDQLIEQQGVVVIGDVTSHDDDDVTADDEEEDRRSTYALITPEAARMLESAGDGSLDVRLRNLADEKEKLHEEIRTLRKEANERERNDLMNGVTSLDGTSSSHNNSLNEMEILEIQREANKLVGEYKVKVQKYEQDLAGLQANVSRMETQIQRHKQTSEQLEKNEDEMRAEKRRLQRDLRTALDRIEEHEITITHLERRLERARAARNQT